MLATQVIISSFSSGKMHIFLTEELLCSLLPILTILKTLIFPVTEGIQPLPSSSSADHKLRRVVSFPLGSLGGGEGFVLVL